MESACFFSIFFSPYALFHIIFSKISQKVASNAKRMLNLRHQIIYELNVDPPLDGIILMCDSDITDVVFDKLSSQQTVNNLAAYSVNLKYIIDAAKNASVPIAIASPVGVLLEGPLGAPNSVRYHDKKNAVKAYTGDISCISEVGVSYFQL